MTTSTDIHDVRRHNHGKAIREESTYRGYTLLHFGCGDVAIFAAEGEHLETATTLDHATALIDDWHNAP